MSVANTYCGHCGAMNPNTGHRCGDTWPSAPCPTCAAKDAEIAKLRGELDYYCGVGLEWVRERDELRDEVAELRSLFDASHAMTEPGDEGERAAALIRAAIGNECREKEKARAEIKNLRNDLANWIRARRVSGRECMRLTAALATARATARAEAFEELAVEFERLRDSWASPVVPDDIATAQDIYTRCARIARDFARKEKP